MAHDEAWPLSAAATAYLRDSSTSASDVLKLTLKELVLRRVWRLERRERSGMLKTRNELVLAPGDASVPADLVPLPAVDEALRSIAGPDGELVEKAVRKVDGGKGDLRRAVRDELSDRDLIRLERAKVLGLVPRTKVRATPAGEALITDSWVREATLRAGLGDARDLAQKLEAIVAVSAVALLAHPSLVPEIEELFDELSRDRSAAGGGYPVFGLGSDDDGGWDAFDPSFDSAIDSGGSDGGAGGGGDGGGGDGGGG